MQTKKHALATCAALAGLAVAWTAAVAARDVVVPEAEQSLHKADPQLYALARQYFPADDKGIPAKRVFRLTRDQIDLTVQGLLPKHYAKSVKSVMAKDPLQTNYEFAELIGINAANWGALSGWIGEIAERVRKAPDGVINCASDKPTDDCLTTEAQRFAMKAFRGDVPADKLAKITKFYVSSVKATGFAAATGDLVEVVLNSPHFLFRRELSTSNTQRLEPAQLLQAVTYTIADAPPEKLNLKSENATQYLRSGAEAGAIIDTIVRSKASREKLARFFHSWLEVKDPNEFTISAQVFPEFKPPLTAAMLDETTRFLQSQLQKDAPTLKDITQSVETTMSKPLEAIYGTKVDDANASRRVALDPAQRLGIFTQPAVIASHSGPTDTRLIKRGVFWARKVMCMELEPPPPDIHAKLYDLKGATEREKVEQSTSGGACAGCHKIINPFGFMQESYDALGRWRTKEPNGNPIDTSLLVDFLDEKPKPTKTSVEALKMFTDSAMFKQCFVRQMFRFYMGRQEEASDDPLLRRMFFDFAHKDEQDILKMVFMLSSSDRIVRRQ